MTALEISVENNPKRPTTTTTTPIRTTDNVLTRTHDYIINYHSLQR